MVEVGRCAFWIEAPVPVAALKRNIMWLLVHIIGVVRKPIIIVVNDTGLPVVASRLAVVTLAVVMMTASVIVRILETLQQGMRIVRNVINFPGYLFRIPHRFF